MRPITKSQTGAGSTAPLQMNVEETPFNVGIAVVVSGTGTTPFNIRLMIFRQLDIPQAVARGSIMRRLPLRQPTKQVTLPFLLLPLA